MTAMTFFFIAWCTCKAPTERLKLYESMLLIISILPCYILLKIRIFNEFLTKITIATPLSLKMGKPWSPKEKSQT
ncbi:MAG: hypothetical protein ACJAU4_001805 [Glaciecola sp.]|jgi:hypothetical protein